MTAQLTFDAASPPRPDGGPEWWVLGLLEDGRTWSRNELVYIVSVPDRCIRRAIANLRDMGYPILSDSEHAGYRLATSSEEVAHTVAEFRSRAQKLLDTAYSLEKAAYRLGTVAA